MLWFLEILLHGNEMRIIKDKKLKFSENLNREVVSDLIFYCPPVCPRCGTCHRGQCPPTPKMPDQHVNIKDGTWKDIIEMRKERKNSGNKKSR